jgi:hypothetical protein
MQDDGYLEGAAELETFITCNGDDPQHDDAVRRRVDACALLALGEPTADPAGSAHLLHCAVPVGETTIVMLPAFTRIEHVAAAVAMNPAWQWLHVLGIDGAVILQDVGPGEWLGINPWSGHEFKLPSAGWPPAAGHN